MSIQRVRREAYMLYVGEASVDVEELNKVAMPLEILIAITRLQPPATDEELQVILYCLPEARRVMNAAGRRLW